MSDISESARRAVMPMDREEYEALDQATLLAVKMVKEWLAANFGHDLSGRQQLIIAQHAVLIAHDPLKGAVLAEMADKLAPNFPEIGEAIATQQTQWMKEVTRGR